MHLTRLPGLYAVARSGPASPVPSGVLEGAGFRTVARTEDELSIVAPEDDIRGMDKIEPGWTAFKVQGPFAFDETGIVADLSRILAEREIGIFVISTYDTDYILVKQADADAAGGAWQQAGHTVA